MSKTITVRLPDILQKRLVSVSREEHIPISDLVRKSLERFISARRFRRLRAQVMPFAESRGILTDEDVFREIS